MEIYIRLDLNQRKYTRSSYSFITWFALLGGVTQVFRVYFKQITVAVTKKLFENAILSDLFFVKKRSGVDQEFLEKERMLDKLVSVEAHTMSVLNKAAGGGEDDCRPVTHREKDNFEKLKKSLTKKTVGRRHVHQLINHVIKNRQRY